MFIEPPPSRMEDIYGWLLKLQERLIQDDMKGSKTWDPGSIPANGDEHTDVTVTNAELGDYAIASFSLDITDDLIISAEVSSANTVTVHLMNHGAGAVDLASGTLYVRVFRRTT